MAVATPQQGQKVTQIGESDGVLKLCDELEEEIVELKVNYEQYFLGLERRPPAQQHSKLSKRMRELRAQATRQTAVKFRVASLAQKLTSYERLWERTIKEIESGTYKRDLFKAKLHGRGAEKKDQKDQKDPKQGDKKDAASSDSGLFHVEEDLEMTDFGGDDLASALADAAASVKTPQATASAGLPAVVPAIPALVLTPAKAAPAVKVTGTQPALTPLTPATPKPAVTGVQPPFRPGITGTNPVFTPSGAQPAVAASKGATGSTGLMPVLTPAKPIGTPDPVPLVARNTASQPAFVPKAPPKPVAADGGLSDQKIKAIYDAYVTAKRRCGEDVSSLSLNSVADTLKKQVPALMKQHNAKTVEFKVVIKEGKAVLRALPKDSE